MTDEQRPWREYDPIVQNEIEAERARADAAKAQRDRLAAALREIEKECVHRLSGRGVNPRWLEGVARAALADVPDDRPKCTCPPIPGARFNLDYPEVNVRTKHRPECPLVDVPEPTGRLTDDERAAVERTIANRDRARRRDEAYWAMVEALEQIARDGDICLDNVQRALALARQVEEA